jgi:2-desacetyl-2-hydroxyethyl bacteriochlorophyllide A dehydrogenase
MKAADKESRMKAAVLTGPERIEIQELARPVISGDGLLVKLKSCGICTLEQRLYTGEIRIHYPLVPGHEAAGEVVEVGPGVLSDIKVGARVALDLVERCGECYYCRTGQSNLCENRFKRDQKILGGFAEYIAVKASQAFPIPPSLSFREAAFAEPLSCCIRSLKKVGVRLAEDLLIIGAGPMGQLHLRAALCMGARVFISDPDLSRLEVARKAGAFLAIDPAREDLPAILREHTEGRGVDNCVVTSVAHTALDSAFASVRKNGRVNIYTSYIDRPPLPVDANTLHRTELTVTGSEGRTEEDFLQSVRLLSFGKVDVKPLISLTVGLGGIEEGLKASLVKSNYRVLL